MADLRLNPWLGPARRPFRRAACHPGSGGTDASDRIDSNIVMRMEAFDDLPPEIRAILLHAGSGENTHLMKAMLDAGMETARRMEKNLLRIYRLDKI